MDDLTDSDGAQISKKPYSFKDFQWNEETARRLISLIQAHFDEFYDKTLKKKIIWIRICKEMQKAGYDCTSHECERKWRSMKKSYISVLQRNVQGDFSSKYKYFDQLHSFLGKEIDPLGMREKEWKKINTTRSDQISVEDHISQTPFYEVTNDNGFEWSEEAVGALLDMISKQRSVFEYETNVDIVWEIIGSRLAEAGFAVTGEQCQRKWLNLLEGCAYYQADLESTGIYPSWPHFERVEFIKNSSIIPVKLESSELNLNPTRAKTSPTSYSVSSALKRMSGTGPARKSRPRDAVLDSLENLEANLRVGQRFADIENRAEAAKQHLADVRQTNALLSLILTKLRSINKNLCPESSENNQTDHLVAESISHNHGESISLDQTQATSLSLGQTHAPASVSLADDEAACRQAILDMPNVANIQFIKVPKVELMEGVDNNGIIIVEGI